MKTVKDKYLVVGADFAGFPLKEAVVAHLEAKGWKILDLGVKKDSDPDDTDLMFHRVGLRVGAEISEGNYERAMIFCGTGMGGLFYGNPHQVWVQIVSIAGTWVFVYAVSRIILKVVDLCIGLRVDADSELSGLDLSQHNERGYSIQQ